MDEAIKLAVEVYTLQFGQEMRVVHAIQHSAEDKYLEQLSQTIETMVSQLKEDKHRSSDANCNST